MKRRNTKLKPYKVSRGSFEEQKLREDKKAETQRALLFILPVLMIAVLIVGIFFGYKSYEQSEAEQKKILAEAASSQEPEYSDPKLLSVVSSASPLPADYVPELTECRGVQVSPDMADNLEKMLSDAEEAGYPITLKEGYISFEEQKERYDTAVDKYRKKAKVSLVKAESNVRQTIPRAGESEQQTGLVVRLDDDVKGRFENSGAYKWLLSHAIDYGFILRYPEAENVGGLSFSPQLFRFVGEENAFRMREYNLGFDEYVVYMSFR